MVEASRATHRAAGAAAKAGAIDSAYQFHWKRFCSTFFPKGTGFPPSPRRRSADDLPLAPVQAYSIDDSQTTEIDDALSVQGLGTGTVVLGIHIAAPGLAIQPGGAVDQLAASACPPSTCRATRSPCCPTPWCRPHAARGRANPAVSLYVTWTRTPGDPGQRDRLERVPVANLRHDQLDSLVTEAWLTDPSIQPKNAPARRTAPRGRYHFYTAWPKQTEARARAGARGKPETFNRPTTTSACSAANGARARQGSERCRSRAPARRAAGPDRGRGRSSPTAPGASWLAELACPASTAARPAWRRA